MKGHKNIRKIVQFFSGLIVNSNFKGFINGKIYKGPLKKFCIPGMNCYSCPGAFGACPIGSIQAVIGSKNKFPFLIVAYLALIGVIFGRFVCGWLCLFGLFQELLYKIPTPKIKLPIKIDKKLRLLKYVFLIVFVFLLPAFFKTGAGYVTVPFFCKYICPVGTLEAGVPSVILNESLQNSIHSLFIWKTFILGIFLILPIFIYRPFCKYVCPLGAFYSIFQKFSIIKLQIDSSKCNGCNNCSKQCKMNVNVIKDLNSPECIRCGDCVKTCPNHALKFSCKEYDAKANIKNKNIKE